MSTLRFCVIGCGNIAIRESIPALLASDLTDVSVCIDHGIHKKELIQEKFQLPFVTSLDEAVAKYDFDAVYIATPTGTHKDIAIKSAQLGKHILCEKSLASNLMEVKEIVDTCKANRVALFEGFAYQFHSQHKLVNQLMRDEDLGEAFHFQAWFGFPPLPPDNFRYNQKKGGGALLDAGAYTIHAARNFFKKEPIKIQSIIEKDRNGIDIRGNIMLDFGNNSTATLLYGFNNSYLNQYHIWTTQGMIKVHRAFSIPAELSPVLSIKTQSIEREINAKPDWHFVREFEYFANNYLNNTIQDQWLKETVNQAKVLDTIRRANPS